MSLLVESVVPLNISSSRFFIFMNTIKWHLCLRLWFSQGINLDGWLQAYPTYHTGLATALGISYASRSAFET